MAIDIELYWLKIPLKRSYQLSFARIDFFDTFICIIKSAKGTYWGESTALPGYSWETPLSIWSKFLSLLELENISVKKIYNFALNNLENSPFAITPIFTALEKYKKGFTTSNIPEKISIPIVGTIQGNSLKDLIKDTEAKVDNGYNTLKIKLSNNVHKDIERVKNVQNIIPEKVQLRMDANQIYNEDIAKLFVDSIQSDKIELLEQPFQPNNWDAHERLSKICPFGIMLDESIWTLNNIKKAYDSGIKAVKLKLAKHGNFNNTIKLIRTAKSFNMKIIFGNGVQTDLGCLDECLIYYLEMLNTSGEMNGFTKIVEPLIENISVKNGNAIFYKISQENFNKKFFTSFRKYTYKSNKISAGE